eukprot:GFYU01022353.1.p1 GENE.GFYU01022353.1~~GFYU01022353.1.p1  ORF type:complete len:525 (-),score=72.46 GFYU01022353.1:108-1682(-)
MLSHRSGDSDRGEEVLTQASDSQPRRWVSGVLVTSLGFVCVGLLSVVALYSHDHTLDANAAGSELSYGREMWDVPDARVPQVINDVVREMKTSLHSDHNLRRLFANAFPHTLKKTTVLIQEDSGEEAFIFTGDIWDMWLRDSAAQVHVYLPFAKESEGLRRVIKGLIRRHERYIQHDPYANSFRRHMKQPWELTRSDEQHGKHGYVATYNYELDSLCSYVWLASGYVQSTGDTSVLTSQLVSTIRIIVDQIQCEQRHSERSQYRYVELPNGGLGPPVNYTGMSWSGYRPSDDACQYGYHVPSNMFAVVVLERIVSMWAHHPILESLEKELCQGESSSIVDTAQRLRDEIDYGITSHAIVDHPEYGHIFAYEVDGLGRTNLMDDANVPSLLSIPYLGYLSKYHNTTDIYANTRRFALSHSNPWYFSGSHASGIGSSHTGPAHVWPMSLIMQGLTSTDFSEVRTVINTLKSTTGGTHYMHESFNVYNPRMYTRSWFAWPNSLVAELIFKYCEMKVDCEFRHARDTT